MNNIYIHTIRKVMPKLIIGLALTLIGNAIQAQQSSSGNTTIFGEAQMTLFGDHNFATGGAGTQPGIINTVRTVPMGVLNFAGTTNVTTGCNNANYVDGYARKFGNSPFIFPVGDNGHYRPFAAAASGTMGAYFFASPNTATVPAGGPFPTAAINSGLVKVSTSEFWDIDGNKPTTITLTWDLSSGISALTGSALDKLTIAGWNGTEWVSISSLKDAVSVIGGPSTLASGSITTTGPIIPDNYIAYTLGARSTPLPVKLVSFTVSNEGDKIHLNWSTSEETNASYFNIERSHDAKSWGTIGKQKTSEEISTIMNYEFTDTKPISGLNYYRLKMVDADESYAYSMIRDIKVTNTANEFLSIYPNPVQHVIFLGNESGQSAHDGIVKEVSILNLSGIEAYKSHSFPATGISVSNLSNGIYYVKITKMSGAVSTHKIVVNK